MFALATGLAAVAAASRSVLLITIDDLRPQLGAYGIRETLTPNVDRLAAGGTVFLHAYCQMAVCSPSRNSFMTGRRPDTTKVWNFIDHFREAHVGANWTSLPQYFKRHGFATHGSGKLFHPSKPPRNDFPESWTAPDDGRMYYWGNGAPIGDAGNCNDARVRLAPATGEWGSSAACYTLDDAAALNDHDNATEPQATSSVEYDHRVVTRAIESMEHAVAARQPFFVAAGIRKPHLDWRVPGRFHELYLSPTTPISVAKHQTIGRNITRLAFELNGAMGQIFRRRNATAPPPSCPARFETVHSGLMNASTATESHAATSAECCALCARTPACRAWTFHQDGSCWRTAHPVAPHSAHGVISGISGPPPPLPPGSYRASPDGPPLPQSLQRALRAGYYSAVSFMDFEVGRALDALDRLGVAEATAVLFHADHGSAAPRQCPIPCGADAPRC